MDEAGEIPNILLVYERIRSIKSEWAQEEREHALKRKKFNEQIAYWQKQCTHNWKYVPDASGNNDSYHHCDICGLDD